MTPILSPELPGAPSELRARITAAFHRDEAEHLADGITQGGADAVLAASIFHYGEFTVGQAKQHMAERGIPVRF